MYKQTAQGESYTILNFEGEFMICLNINFHKICFNICYMAIPLCYLFVNFFKYHAKLTVT